MCRIAGEKKLITLGLRFQFEHAPEKKYWPGKIGLNLTVSIFKRPSRVRYTPGLGTHSATQRAPSARLSAFFKIRPDKSGCGPVGFEILTKKVDRNIPVVV